MKSFGVNLLTATFLLAQSMMTYAQGPTDILFYSDGKSLKTWEQGQSARCDPVMKPDGSRLVKVYQASRVSCSYFTDAECKNASDTPAEVVDPGLRDISDTATGYGKCEPAPPT